MALDDVSLRLEAAQTMAIWGADNSGKTTLLRLAAGLDQPDLGQVRYDGRDLSACTRRERAKLLRSEIGCIWRALRTPPGLSILDEVALPLARSGDARTARARAQAMLEEVDGGAFAGASWDELEDGDRARVNVAHALVREPRLLLADEPTAKLNVVEREQLLGLLDRISAEREIAVLMTAPGAPDTLRSQRLASLDRGQLIEPERAPGKGQVADLSVARRRS
ncbi:MAG TPA: ATP-binding cassette domain-containing protein [Thermoleophilaceae bacterium]